MKRDTLKRLAKSFNKKKDFIYLAGPFFNPVQEEWAMKLACILREIGYKVFAPVDQKFEEGSKLSAPEIFQRNIEWMCNSKLILAQVDYPLEVPEILCVVHQETWIYKPVNLPDPGTVWEMGFAYAKNIPVIGYMLQTQVTINLMLAEGLAGYIEDKMFNIFEERGINWNLIKRWKGRKI